MATPKERTCPVHRRKTVNRLCVDCLDEAHTAVRLIESGVAAACAWASSKLGRTVKTREAA